MKNLSDRQVRIVDFIRSYLAENGYPPTFREIGNSVGLKSPSTVDHHMKKLREMGVLQYEEGHFRSIQLPDGPEEAAPPRGTVPLLGQVAAGAPILAEECVEEYIPFDVTRPEDCFALRVRGESMLNAGILPDDLVIVRRQPEAYSGEIVVALFEDEATVKTLSRKNGQVWLLPENPDYEPIDGARCQIIGKVVGLVRRYY